MLVDCSGMQVHAIHARGVGPDPLPLVITHGWPSTFFEMHKVIGPLSDPAAHTAGTADAFMWSRRLAPRLRLLEPPTDVASPPARSPRCGGPR